MNASVLVPDSDSVAVLGKVVLDEQTIQRRVKELASKIAQDYRGRELVIAGILDGAWMFTCDLVRQMAIPVQLDFVCLSRYQPPGQAGPVTVLKDLEEPLWDRHLLLVEDIVDTGLTLHYLVETLKSRNPASLAICTLLSRPELRLADIPLRYVGFDVSREFLVGYGLDYRNRFRHLPYISTLVAGR